MSTWAVIPAKSPRAAKTRLAPAVPPDRRATLARRLLAGTVRAALGCPSLAGAIVVSAAPELRALAADLGARTCPDPPGPRHDGLNAAIASGCHHAAALGAAAVLVLPADLPLLAPEVIAEFLDEAGDAPVALVPDRCGTGTNALLLRPPLVLDPAFGAGSFARHVAAARARGLAVATVCLPELAFDLDTPADLDALGLAGWPALEAAYG